MQPHLFAPSEPEQATSNEIQFVVPAIPIAQPRPRAVAVNGKARVFGAPKQHPVHAFKATCRLAFEYYDRECDSRWGRLDGPLGIELWFVLPRPKLPKKLGTGRLPHTKRPDFDNLEKSVVDALTGIAWRDDAQLCDVRTRKFIAAVGEQPHVVIKIRPL